MVRTLSQEKRIKLLNSALTLFAHNGVMNTSTAEIAKEAGVAAGTLFLYFPTKQDLLDQLALKIGREQSATINHLLEQAGSARQAFFSIWQGSVTWFLDNLEAFQYLQQVRDAGMISEAAVQESNQFFLYYYNAIQQGFQEGSIKAYPPGLIGDFLYHDIVAVIQHLRRQPEPGQHAQIIRQGFEIFWAGIQSDPKEGFFA